MDGQSTGGSRIPPPIPARPNAAAISGSEQVASSAPFFGQPYVQPYGGYAGMCGIYPQNTPFVQNRFGFDGAPADYGFLRAAEESSKNAFQSVESVASAVVSVANMLNSTHNAVFSSFRAVAGVIEQFKSIKQYLVSHLLLSIWRWTHFLWRRCLALLRLKPRNYASSSQELVWSNIHMKDPRVCPSLLFWLVALGGPILIYKSVVQIAQRAAASRLWATGDGEHYTAQALYDFCAANNSELSFCAFDMLRIAPKCEQPNMKDWLLASTFDGTKIGIVPINYIKLIGKSNGNSNVSG